jgi:lipoate---protein ligase
MKYLELTLSTPEANLAGDEILLDRCEEGEEDELLRFWEPRDYFIVVGYAGRVEEEVNLANWQRRPVPILRRCSGGGTVVQGPHCLNYSLVLKIADYDPLGTVTGANTHIMQRHQAALAPLLGSAVAIQGSTDLTLRGLKFSGNAQRRRRQCLLFHGTFLLDFDMDMITTLLAHPRRQPDYRRQRTHRDFLTNLRVPAREIKEALRKAWGADQEMRPVPLEPIQQLARQKYSSPEWIILPG